MKDRLNKLLLGIVKFTGLLPAALFFKWKVIGKKNARAMQKPYLIVSNHKKLMDLPSYMILFVGRTIRFLISEVMYNKSRGFGRFLDAIGGIKVDRFAYDFGFIGKSVQVLDRGGIVCIFPEGKLPTENKMLEFHPSAVIIAVKAHVPVLPIYTDGNYGLFKRTGVVIGEPLDLYGLCNTDNPTREQISEMNDVLRNEIVRLGETLTNGK